MGRAQFSFIRTKWLRAGIPARPKYTCNYEGGSSEGGPQTRDLSQMVMWSDRLSWPRSCSETHFYVSISLTWVGLGLHHFHAGQAPASSFRPGSGLGRALVSRLEVGPFSSFLGLAQRGPWKPRGFFFFFCHSVARQCIFLRFLLLNWGGGFWDLLSIVGGPPLLLLSLESTSHFTSLVK